MEVIPHPERALHPDVVREHSVQRTPQLSRCPAIGYFHAGGLAKCMNAGIGAAGTQNRHRTRAQSFQAFFDDTLNRALSWLALPAGEARSVIVKHQLNGSRPHCPSYRAPLARANRAVGVDFH